MKNHRKSAIAVGAMLLALSGSAFGWGMDVPIWTSGTVDAFDTDYAMDGTMFVGFQAGGENTIRIMRSTDHGLHWSLIDTLPTNDATFSTSPRSNLSRIRLLYDEPNDQLFVFFQDSAGYLYRWRLPIVSLSQVGARVSQAPMQEGSFDVSWDLKASGRKLFASWTEGNGAGDNIYIKYTTSLGPVDTSWTTGLSTAWGTGADTRHSLAFGPNNNVFWSYSTRSYGGGSLADSILEIATSRSTDGVTTWPAVYTRLTDDSYKDYDPRTAAANVTNSGVWIAYNRDRGSHEIDLMFKYSGDGGTTWNPAEYTVSSGNGVDEYIADIKPYKASGNPYIDMIYIYDNPAGSPVRKAMWAWTSTGAPTTWNGTRTFNDHDITSWPEDVAPRLVYSPGAAGSGGGAVFAGAGQNGLYFDAPWIAGMPLPTSPTTISHAVVATPVNGSAASTARPLAVSLGATTATVKVAFSEFAAAVDLYVVIAVPGMPDLQAVNSSNAVVLFNMASPAAWMTNTTGPVDVTMFSFPRASIPSGAYTIYFVAVPAGTNPATFNLASSSYYMWTFNVTN